MPFDIIVGYILLTLSVVIVLGGFFYLTGTYISLNRQAKESRKYWNNFRK